MATPVPRHGPTFPVVPRPTRVTLLAASSLTVMAGAIVAPALSPVLAHPLVERDGPAAAFEACGVGMVALGVAYAARTAWLRRPTRPTRDPVAAESLVTS